MTSFINIHDLTVFRGDKKVLNQFNLQVSAGTLVTLTGTNGSGKSTLIKALLGLIPYSGHVHSHAKQVGYLPQSHYIDRSFPVTALEFIQLGISSDLRQSENLNHTFKSIWEPIKNKLIGELSQGEFQKVLFLRSILQTPDLLVLDEPFSNIDEDSALILKNELLDLKASGTTIILSIHDSSFVKANSDQIILLGPDSSQSVIDPCVHVHPENL